MKTSQKYVFSILFAATATLANSVAWAHATLQRADPAQDAQLGASPKEVVLRFNEKLEAAFSSIKVVDSTGKEVSAAKAMLGENDPSQMKVALPALAPGKYTVHFVAVGDDGHRRKGTYSFTVK